MIPRLTYGIDSVRLLVKDFSSLTLFFKRLLKQIQNLPERSADVGAYILTGQLPIEGEIHKRTLTTFGNIIRSYGSVERELAHRQLAMKTSKSYSWFIMVSDILNKYDLPSIYDLLESPPGKITWKTQIYSAVHDYWKNIIVSEARSKSSLKYINFTSLKFGTPHIVWQSAGSETMNIQKAMVKAKLLTGTYILQSNRHKFNQHEVKPDCPLCNNGCEDLEHFIVICEKLAPIRAKFMASIEMQLQKFDVDINYLLSNTDVLLQLVLDCTVLPCIPHELAIDIENISRGLVYALHVARCNLLQLRK